ncbi:MAG: hypothetical protein SGI77_06390 [Pirellulaceae bacterium]|nr:hypothetical protein [Pirellulaceae bacterium]
MSEFIGQLAKKLASGHHDLPIQVHVGEKEILIEVTLGSRKQSVRVSLGSSKAAGGAFVRLVSRACPANDHRLIRSALTTNRGLELGSLSLNTETNPPVLDVVHSVVAEGVQIPDLLFAIESVARLADSIEKRIVGQDVF